MVSQAGILERLPGEGVVAVRAVILTVALLVAVSALKALHRKSSSFQHNFNPLIARVAGCQSLLDWREGGGAAAVDGQAGGKGCSQQLSCTLDGDTACVTMLKPCSLNAV